MKDNYISYYELLTRIKERNIPQLLILHLVPTKSVEYITDYDYVSDKLVGYEILNDKDEDENYSYYLGDCFLESTMFDKVIEIIEEEKGIEHYNLVDNYKNMSDKIIANNFKHINEELEWLVREIKKLKEQTK